MSALTRKAIRDLVLDTTQQDSTQIGSLINLYMDLTMQEINSPAWAFRNDYNHLWSFLRRKTTFTTTSGTSDYILERDIDKIALIRQTATPARLRQVSDDLFFQHIPNPTESGNPIIYRQWAVDGVSTALASADLVDVLSSSALDSSTFTATVVGYVSGRLIAANYTLNGTAAVAGTNTFDARELIVSKSGVTTGNITFRRNSNSATLLVLGPQEISARFKVISLYPTPSSTLTMYVEYFKRLKTLVNDSDVPEFDEKYHFVVQLGTLAKVYQHLGKVNDAVAAQGAFASGVRAMVASDSTEPDYIEHLQPRFRRSSWILDNLDGTVS